MASECQQSNCTFLHPSQLFLGQCCSLVQGAICLDTLSTAWSPVLTIKSALLSLQSLLSTPEPKDPQDAEVARMLVQNPKEFERVAREWAFRFAGAPKIETGEGSGGATKETLKQVRQKSREEEERERLAAYASSSPPHICWLCADVGSMQLATRAITRISLIDSSTWASTSIELCRPLNSSGSTRMTVRTTSSRRHIWEISRPDCSGSRDPCSRWGFHSHVVLNGVYGVKIEFEED